MSLTLLAPIEPAASPETAPSLTAEQKRLIRDSFTTVEPASDLVARLFYMKSIDLDPSLAVLFKAPTRGQRRRFMAAMKLAILSLDRLQELQPIVKLLIAQKRQEGVTLGRLRHVPARLGVDARAIAARTLPARGKGRLDLTPQPDDRGPRPA